MALTATSKELAAVLGVSLGRISQMRKDGLLKAEGHPLKYDLPESVQAYIKFCVDSARGKNLSDEDAERKKLRAEADYKEAKARQEEIKLAELEGRMHSAEDVQSATEQLVYAVRAGLIAMPGRVAVDAAMKPAPEVSETVRRECSALLESLSDFRYDPKAYADMVRERQGWQTGEDDGEE